jgi:hypothetical protein
MEKPTTFVIHKLLQNFPTQPRLANVHAFSHALGEWLVLKYGIWCQLRFLGGYFSNLPICTRTFWFTTYTNCRIFTLISAQNVWWEYLLSGFDREPVASDLLIPLT